MEAWEYDFWLLDLDGTVVDTERSYIHDVMGTVADRLGMSVSDREAELLWYGAERARERLLAEADVDPERFWAAFHAVEEPAARAEATYVYGDAERFVPAIERPVGVVTHCQSHLTGPILDRLDIADWFDTVVCCSEETGWKPDPAPVELAIADLGVGDELGGAMAGDHPQDVLAARNAGLDGIHVSRPGREWTHDRPVGDRRVAALTDLSG